MAQSLAHRLLTRYDGLVRDSANFRNQWQELADFIQPNKNTIIRQTAKGQRRTDRVFDSTGIVSNNRLAAFIAGSLTNMTIKWFSMKLENEDLTNDRDVLKWLDHARDVSLKWLRSSNFNTEIQEAYRDLGGFGTAALLEDEMPKKQEFFSGLLWRAEAIGTYVVAENPEGLVDSMFRVIELTPLQMKKKWGEAAMSTQMRSKLAPGSQHMDTPQKVLHVVMPRGDVPTKGITRLKMPWASYYVEMEHKHVLSEGGYHEFPYMVPRWAKSAGEVYGRGPGNDAYPDIRTLNKAMELIFRAWGKSIDPPVNVLDDGVVGRVSTVPAAVNIVRDKDAITPWPIASRFEVNTIMLQDLRSSIKSIFFADQLQLPDKTIITATEVERRIEMAQQVLGPTIGRLEYELLAPLINRTFQILSRAGEIAPPPDIVRAWAKQRGVNISVQYEGPLARAQRSNDLQAISRLLSFVSPMAELNPEVLDVINFDKLVEILGQQSGAPTEIINAKEVIDKTRKMRAEANAKMTGGALAEQGGKTAKHLADAALAIDQTSGGPAALAQLSEQQGNLVPQPV